MGGRGSGSAGYHRCSKISREASTLAGKLSCLHVQRESKLMRLQNCFLLQQYCSFNELDVNLALLLP